MSTALSAIRTNVRRYLGESTAARWSNSDIDAFINEGVRWLQSEINGANVDYFTRIETATASAGSFQLALPSDIWGNKLRHLHVYEQSTVATGEGSRIGPGSMDYVLAHSHYSGTPENYVMMAGYLRFAPLLTYNSTFRFVYAMRESTLTNDTDVLTRISDDYIDAIAMYAAIAANDVIGLDSGTLPGRLTARIDHIRFDAIPSDPFTLPQQSIDD